MRDNEKLSTSQKRLPIQQHKSGDHISLSFSSPLSKSKVKWGGPFKSLNYSLTELLLLPCSTAPFSIVILLHIMIKRLKNLKE